MKKKEFHFFFFFNSSTSSNLKASKNKVYPEGRLNMRLTYARACEVGLVRSFKKKHC